MSVGDLKVSPDVSVDNPELVGGHRPPKSRRRRGGPTPRLPPLFARDVGHVTFVGNERLPDAEPERGCGSYVG